MRMWRVSILIVPMSIAITLWICKHPAEHRSEDQGGYRSSIARGYFRLGAACAQNVMLRHELNGTRVPVGDALLQEALEFNRTFEGGSNDNLLYPQ